MISHANPFKGKFIFLCNFTKGSIKGVNKNLHISVIKDILRFFLVHNTEVNFLLDD